MWNNSGQEMWNNGAIDPPGTSGGPPLAPPGTGGVGGSIPPPPAAQPSYTVLPSPAEAEASLLLLLPFKPHKYPSFVSIRSPSYSKPL
ncbi:hypothetical protein HanRHA438_Chr14g0678611 [Helianthus annuus]|nr:hypothetical protein HanRHA438_Chr14g0678611 [Helianthus annuus]